MVANNFKTYLERGRPFGDAVDLPFVDHAVTDGELPDPTSWEELENYIKQCNPNAPANTLDAAKHVLELYLKESHS